MRHGNTTSQCSRALWRGISVQQVPEPYSVIERISD